MHRPSLLLLTASLTAAFTWTAGAPAQQVLFRAGGAIATPAAASEPDDGPAVEMFESPNLDRFLRRARQFLQEEKFAEAILVLQAVIEGRTLEAGPVPDAESPASPIPAAPPASGAVAPAGAADPATGAPAAPSAAAVIADPAQTVFSADGRLFRPARRLCHEYLAGMPPAGIELYRAQFEAKAADLLVAAQQSGLVSDLERVANRYFATLAAGRAMQVLADRHMHEGRYRAAVQVLRDLAELYPAANLRQLGIAPLWCRFKVALCLRLAGEFGAALDSVRQLAEAFPDESLRVMGELQSVRDLAASPLFAVGDDALVATIGPAVDAGLRWLDARTETLVPLWQYRFAGPDPYAGMPAQGNDRQVFWGGDAAVANVAPYANKYGTGVQIAFLGRGFPAPQAVFFENFRLRVADAFTGIVYGEGDGESEPQKPREMRARARVPVYDHALLRPVEDDERYYAILGRNKIDQGVDSLKINHLVAYAKDTGQRVWSSESFYDGDDGLADVTFLAAPTLFGERLLMPVLRRGAYELQCLDRRTGRPLWHTRLHSGGSHFFKAPGSRVAIAGNLAYVVTNAGGLAAVDAFAGDLRWVRKYERSDPLRQKPVGRRAPKQEGMFFNSVTFVESDLTSFLPSEVITLGGTVVFAGCDSDMLLCLDGASGEPVWMLDGATRYAPYGRLRYLIGTDDEHLFVAAESDLQTNVVCIDHASGVVRWMQPVPGASDRITRWRGRGCVFAGHVLMPADRELFALATAGAADGAAEWRRIALPALGIGDEPLHGPNNLFAAGPWLGVAYTQGIELYSTESALRALAGAATVPREKAALLVAAGDAAAAIATLEQWLQQADPIEPARREQAEDLLLGLAREQALSLGKDGVALLDRVRRSVRERRSLQSWHLARLDLFRQISDLRAYEDEQQRLYRLMEGRN